MKKQTCLILLCLLFGSFGFSAEVLTLRLTNDCAEVQFDSLINKQYTVEFSEDLKSWISAEEEIFGTGSMITLTHQVTGSRGFFRSKRSDEFTVTFPSSVIEIGSEWNYSIEEEFMGETISYTLTERVERYSTKNGYEVVEIDSYTNGNQWAATVYVLQDITNGFFVAGIKDSDGEDFFNPPEATVFNGFIPGVAEAPVVIPSPEPGFGPGTLVRTVFIDYSPVSVPAGTFQNTVKVEMKMSGIYDFGGGISGSYTLTEVSWYDRTVGEIKNTSVISMGGYGAVASEIIELTSYTLNEAF